jgi:anti-sigma regulatory factor (Ser/Thr protein kinase)
VRAAVDRFAAANQLSLDEAADLHVALDEILTNIIKYGYTDDRPHEICVQLGVERGMLVVTIEDDGRAFDPLMLPEPDVNISLRQRQPGGLGIHFVRKLMTEVKYNRSANINRLVLKRELKR